MGSDALFALAVVLAVSSTVVDGQDGSFTIKTGRAYTASGGGRIAEGQTGYNRNDVFDVHNDDCVCTDTVTTTQLPYRYFVVKAGVQQNGDFWSVAYDGRDCNIFFYSSACNIGNLDPVEVVSYGAGEIPTGVGEGLTGITHIQDEENDIDGFKSYEVCCFGVEDVPQQGPAPYVEQVDAEAIAAISDQELNAVADYLDLNPAAYGWILTGLGGGSGGRRLLQDSKLNVAQLMYSNRCSRACNRCIMLLALAVCLSPHPPQMPDRSGAC